MAHTDGAWPSSLGGQLDRWLATLDGQGLRTGVRERLAVQRLLAQLAAAGELPAGVAQTLALVAPLLCTSREQQRRYAALLKTFVDGDASPASAADIQRPPVAQRRIVLAAAAAGLVLVLAFALWAWSGHRAGPDLRPAPAASVAVPAAPAAEPARFVHAFYVPPAELPLQPALPPGWAPPLRVVLLAGAALCALALGAAALAGRRRQMALQGLSSNEDLEHHLLHDSAPVDVSPHPVLARAVARALRQRVAGESMALDTTATLRATVAAQGAFSPRWRELQHTPEYLVLVDSRHACDHHAAYVHTLLAALQRAGVALHVFDYDTTPAAGCWAHGAIGNDDIATRQRLPLAALAMRAGRSRLIVFGRADALLLPASCKPGCRRCAA